jgi:hypothetical protein
MSSRAYGWLAALVVGLLAAVAAAQTPKNSSADKTEPVTGASSTPRWRPNTRPVVADAGAEAAAPRYRGPANDAGEGDVTEGEIAPPPPKKSAARVIGGRGSLPAGDGQIWREYDISPYTSRVTSTARPEQAIVDWVLRETGYEVWHQEPVGLLSASQNTLTVYHTPEMQSVVHDVVDRFVNAEAATNGFGLRVVTVDNPNWRARAQRVLQPVAVETQGIQAWLLHTEDAALLMGELRKRTDYREHSSPNLLVANGESTVVSATRAKTFIRDVTISPTGWPGFETQVGQIDEGFSLELSPLLSLDQGTVDAVLKCNIDQVEEFVPVVIDVPTQAAPRQRTKIDVPQISHCRVHERFRWPANQVLIVSLGMVATPVPVTDANPFKLPLPGTMGPPRADLLVIVENRGKVGQVPAVTRAGGGQVKAYHGRY